MKRKLSKKDYITKYITKIMPFLVKPAIIYTLKIYVKFYFILYIYLSLKYSNIWN